MPASAPRIDEAQDYLDKVIESLHAMDRREKQPLIGILEYLSEYIRSTRGEVAAFRSSVAIRPFCRRPPTSSRRSSPRPPRRPTRSCRWRGHGRIEPSVDGPISAKLLSAATRIYEACAFQDITGQRITKVVRAVQHIDQKIRLLAGLAGMAEDGEAPAPTPGLAAGGGTGDAALLNGPQLAGTAHSQDEIDRLFGS